MISSGPQCVVGERQEPSPAQKYWPEQSEGAAINPDGGLLSLHFYAFDF